MTQKWILIFLGAIVLGLQPAIVFATPIQCPDGTVVDDTVGCPNSTTTTETLGRFNPGITNVGGGGDTFSGLNFSGVGGAVLSCTNIADSAMGTVSDLFKSAQQRARDARDATIQGISSGSLRAPGATIGGTQAEQPVTDQKATAELKKQSQRENCLNAVAYAVSKNMLQQVTTRTLSWINTGLSGNPLYVRDPNSFLKNIRDQKLTEYLGTVADRDPIFGNAIRSTITQQVTGYTDGRMNTMMNTPEAQRYTAFQNDFTSGGWDALLDPRNNSLGAYFNAIDTVSTRVNTEQQNIKDELVQGNGFLNLKKCVEWDNGLSRSDVQKDCSATYENQKRNDLAACETRTELILKNSCIQGVTSRYETLIKKCANVDSTMQDTTAQCTRYETVTPGSVIAAQAATITTSPYRQLEQADQINEVLGSFFDQLLTGLFTDGLGGLSGRGNARGTNVVIGTNGLPIESANLTSAERAFGYQAVSGGFNGEFDISRPQQLRAIIKTQIDFINRTKDSQVAMARIIPTLGKLDYCIPGPNPTWKVGTDYNAEIVLSALSGKPPSKALGNTISTISSAAAVIPVYGTVIAIVGNLVGTLVNIGTGDEPKSVETKSLNIFDKVTNGARKISDFYIERGSVFDDISLVDYMQSGYNAVIAYYNTNYDPQTITNALISADRTNTDTYAKARVGEMVDEATNLLYYNQSIAAFDADNVQNISETEDALLKLDAINAEVESIVNDAKKRYIKQNPSVNLSCLNNAYNVSINADGTVPMVTGTVVDPVTKAVRFESDTIDTDTLRSNNARMYFYSHL